MSGQRHAPAALLRKKTIYPLNMRQGGLQSWFGHSGEQNNLLSLPGFELRARSAPESLWILLKI
jgi:hypothetical protein